MFRSRSPPLCLLSAIVYYLFGLFLFIYDNYFIIIIISIFYYYCCFSSYYYEYIDLTIILGFCINFPLNYLTLNFFLCTFLENRYQIVIFIAFFFVHQLVILKFVNNTLIPAILFWKIWDEFFRILFRISVHENPWLNWLQSNYLNDLQDRTSWYFILQIGSQFEQQTGENFSKYTLSWDVKRAALTNKQLQDQLTILKYVLTWPIKQFHGVPWNDESLRH